MMQTARESRGAGVFLPEGARMSVCDICEARKCGPMGCQCPCHEDDEEARS